MFWGHVITVDGTLKKGPLTLIYRADNNRLQEEASTMCELPKHSNMEKI